MKQIVLAIAASFLLSASVFAAGGIPVQDAAHITTSVTNQVETVLKWVVQIQSMKAQIDNQKEHLKNISGPRGMGAVANSGGLNPALPSDWDAVLVNVKKSTEYVNERKKFPTAPGLPKLNAMYDVMASQNTVMSKLYKRSTDRFTVVQALMSQIEAAPDQAAKMDLANRIANEQNAIQANESAATAIAAKQRQEVEAAGQAASKEFSCKEFQSKSC